MAEKGNGGRLWKCEKKERENAEMEKGDLRGCKNEGKILTGENGKSAIRRGNSKQKIYGHKIIIIWWVEMIGGQNAKLGKLWHWPIFVNGTSLQ